MKKCRFLSLVLCIFVLFVNMHAITVKAAPLAKSEAVKIASAILNDQKSFSKKRAGGSDVIIQSFQITNLDAPQNGKLLDSKATVVADNGFSWDIPVIWVDQDGNLAQVAIQIENVRECYPIFAFYLPDGYSFVFNESAFNIGMPDFVCELMEKNGVTTIANPAIGVTYFTALLPGKDRFEAKQPTVADTQSTDIQSSDSDSDYSGGDGKVSNDETPKKKSGKSNNQYESYKGDEKLSDNEKKELVHLHCDDNVINEIGVDNLAKLVSFVKNVLEPEAVSLLEEKFPAYKNASENNELGKHIGLYVYYDSITDGETVKDMSDAVGYVDARFNGDGLYEYQLGINVKDLFVKDEKSDTYVFAGDEAYSLLDCTLVHEMMHGFMDDYVRPGMSGIQYNEETDIYSANNAENVKFPSWFVEGIATTTDNAYQYWNNSLHGFYGYDSEKSEYSVDALKDSYLNNESMRLSFADEDGNKGEGNSKSAYVSGYLANVYLGYLAAVKYDSKDAISGSADDGNLKINSQVILNGVNHILEELHSGKTLDEVIAEISTVDGETLYTGTDDFTAKFIASSDEEVSDGNKSLDFCATLLNYLESNSSGDKIANGSLLLDFTSTSDSFLSKNLIKDGKPNDYDITDSKDFAESTVDSKDAMQAGGKSETGIATSSSDEETDEEEGDTEQEEKVAAKPSDEENDAAETESSTNEDEIESDADNSDAETSDAENSDVDTSVTEDADNEEAGEEPQEEVTQEETPQEEAIQEEEPAGEEQTTEEMTEEASETEDSDVETPENEDVVKEETEEAPQEEIPQTEIPQAEPATVEVPQAEAPQAEVPQTEPAPTEAPQVETPQADLSMHNFIISNSEEPSDDSQPSDNSCEEQVLDAIPQDDSEDGEDVTTESAPEE